MAKSMFKMMMMLVLIMIGCGFQACNGMNVDGSKLTPADSSFVCFRNCSISCGIHNEPCYEDCLTKCNLPQWDFRSTPSSPPPTI
ncbi:PREDICTED: uncharacterized protein LOC104772626 [Camelina sativa]|uniref:Uncharacterized protein LOC104772626 n=1 Tax=Camelina sativa TaxID=90675 RepID=A0ABM0Y4U3_CAMSA|nr:PREDICTED: uncharacterized protein LOC104772626 [Camelina sativa]